MQLISLDLQKKASEFVQDRMLLQIIVLLLNYFCNVS